MSLSIKKYTVGLYNLFFTVPYHFFTEAASCGVEFSNYGVAKKLIRF